MVATRQGPQSFPSAWMTRDCRGSLSLPLLLVFLAAVSAGFGFLGLLRHWRGLVTRQLELDRCVGLAAQALRSELNGLGRLNSLIIANRAALAAATLAPEARPPLQAALKAETLAQEVLRRSWSARRLEWQLRGCAGSHRVPPLPELPLERPPPDPLGERPLEWSANAPASYRIRISYPPRAAAAEVIPYGKRPEGRPRGAEIGKWQALWSDPRGPDSR
jgi:hypothetical protein